MIAFNGDAITDDRRSNLRHEPPVDEQRQEHPLVVVRYDSDCQQQGGYRSQRYFVDIIDERSEGDGPWGLVMSLESGAHRSHDRSLQGPVVVDRPVKDAGAEVTRNYRKNEDAS